MFSNNQLALFNKAYGAYCENLEFLKANLHVIEGEKIEPGMAVIISDINIQKMLFRVSTFPECELEEPEQTFIKSMLEFAGAVKASVPGYGKFYKNMTAQNYSLVSSFFDQESDFPLVLEIAICVEQRTKKHCAQTVIENLATILASYTAICTLDDTKKQEAALHLIASYIEEAKKLGIVVNPIDDLQGYIYGNSTSEKELYSLIGLDEVKNDVSEIIDVIKLNDIRAQNGIAPIKVSKNMVFTGNPGTGKTTVARILSRIYCELGILSKGHLVEVDRSKLVAGYLGQTAIKVQEVVESALGGVLFVDEAYMLSTERGDSYGQEAIDTLLKCMEDNRDNLVVIVAGYPELMEKFINSNPGLRSRFNKYISFPDYSLDELQKIFEKMMQKDGYILSDEAREKLLDIWVKAQKDEGFGNGRGVRNIYEKVIVRQASRIVSTDTHGSEALLTIIADDIPEYKPTKKEKRTIGFG